MIFVDHVPSGQRSRYGALVLFLAVTLGAGAIAGFAIAPEIAGWYAGLQQAVLRAAQLGLRSRLDGPLFFDGRCGMASLAQVRTAL